VRIIAGEYRGRRIETAKGQQTRPTTDRVREAWASTVANLLPLGFERVAALDAFAGSGALGLEAISRGAERCLFYELDRRAFAVLSANLVNLLGDEVKRACSVCGDVLAATALPAIVRQGPYDLVILDPPYALAAERVLGLLSSLARAGALATGAIISYEQAVDSEDILDNAVLCRACSPASLQVVSSKAYGQTIIRYYRFA